MESTLRFIQASNPGVKLWRVIGDEDSEEWGFKSRTLTVRNANGELFSQLPAVYGYSPDPDPKPDNYRVDETPLRDAYLAVNNYDGYGYRRCVNYLWKDDTALYNGQGFPKRELLTMSNNVLEEMEWVVHNGAHYLKFKTLRPADNVQGMTWETRPHLVHRFTLVSWDSIQEETRYTSFINQHRQIYYYLTSVQGYGFMPRRYVKAVG